MPLPDCTRPPAPEMMPFSPKSNAPPRFSAEPAPRSTAFASSRLAVLALSVPLVPVTLSAPVPSAVLLPTARPPALSVVPPV
ncbi:hypothetical protein FEP76_05622 [Burkholderia multivorans]|nr:hypothetical protein [Burkholderia multivorans]